VGSIRLSGRLAERGRDGPWLHRVFASAASRLVSGVAGPAERSQAVRHREPGKDPCQNDHEEW
jgi:hypothetical protein